MAGCFGSGDALALRGLIRVAGSRLGGVRCESGCRCPGLWLESNGKVGVPVFFRQGGLIVGGCFSSGDALR